MLPGPSDSPRTRVCFQTLAPRHASCPHQRRESQSDSHQEWAAVQSHEKRQWLAVVTFHRLCLPATLKALSACPPGDAPFVHASLPHEAAPLPRATTVSGSRSADQQPSLRLPRRCVRHRGAAPPWTAAGPTRQGGIHDTGVGAAHHVNAVPDTGSCQPARGTETAAVRHRRSGSTPPYPPDLPSGHRTSGAEPLPYWAEAAGAIASPAARAASRTAPATHPETFSLKTLGMM